MSKGIFVTFEGGEGSGKTTLIRLIKEKLESLNYKVVSTREPGGSKIAEAIRSIILDVDNTEMDAKTEALLYASSRRQHLVDIVLPALEENKIVLCDRYIDSSLAYQGYARGLGISEVYKINQYATEGIMPKMTFFIDVAPEVGLERIKENNRSENRLDKEKILFHQMVHQGYLIVAKKFKKRIKIINGSRSVNEVYNDIMRIILDNIKEGE